MRIVGRVVAFFRWLLAAETLEPLAGPAAQTGVRRRGARWLLANEELGTEPEPEPAAAVGAKGALSWLFAREELGTAPEPEPAAAVGAKGALSWLFAGEELGAEPETEPPAARAAGVRLRWLFAREPLDPPGPGASAQGGG